MANVPKIPNCFYSREPYRKILDNHGLKGNRLALRHLSIDKILSSTILNTRRFDAVFTAVTGLSNRISEYSTHLLRKSIFSQENHSRSTALDLNRELIDVPGRLNMGKSHYILYKLQNLNNYEALNLLLQLIIPYLLIDG